MEQLIYGSADQIVGRPVGGWGVLHASPDLTAETQQELLRLVSVWLPVTVPQFPSAQELVSRPPRYRAEAQGATGLAAVSVEAGKDHTGRPGNVVTHAARVPLEPGLRVSDWFFADGWVAPFGPAQIAQASLPPELSRPDGWVGTATWLREDPVRVARLRWIVDVAVTLLLQGQTVVLRAPNVPELVRWASALTWMVDTDTARRIRLRLGEDQASLTEQIAGKGPAIVGVCFDPEPGVVHGPYLDVSWRLDAASAASSHTWRLPTGQVLPATADHPAADLVFAADETARAVFAKRDQVVAEMSAELAPPARQVLALQAAWLLTPGAQEVARETAIRSLVENLGPELSCRGEVASLAAELGPAAASPQEDLDVYSLPPTDPAEDPVRAAIIAAARLGGIGINVERMLDRGELLEFIDERPASHQKALRQIAAALHITGEEA